MALITWSESISVGVAEMDQQHKKLIAMVNDMHDAMAKRQGITVLASTFDRLLKYTIEHFSAEERLMLRCKYEGYQNHKAEHQSLTRQVLDLKARFDSGQQMLTIETMNFLKHWLTTHIQGVDKRYTTCLQASGVK